MAIWGCAARDDVIVLDNRLYTMQRQIQQVQEDTDRLKKQLAGRTEQLEKKMEAAQRPLLENQASSLNEIEGLKARLQTLQGRLESLEFSQKKEAVPRAALDTLAKDIKDLQSRVQRLEQPAAPTPPLASAKTEKEAEPVREAKETKEERAEEKGPEKAKPPTPDELLQQARTASKKKNYEEAHKKYGEYLKQAPQGKKREEALFGLAESLGEMKEQEVAILAFQKLIKTYPKSPYVPEALLRQANLFLTLKDSASAKLILEKLIKEYPKSDQAQAARKKIKSL